MTGSSSNSNRISIPPFSQLSLPPFTDSPVTSSSTSPSRAKAHITRGRSCWLVQSLRGSARGWAATGTFRAACDEASLVTLMELRRVGLRKAEAEAEAA